MVSRPKQHQLEDKSICFFQSKLPDSWLTRDKSAKDYGIDLEIEIFNEKNDNTTGMLFFVQMKSSCTGYKSTIDLDKFGYYKTLPVPVLIVFYNEETEGLYYVWSKDIDLSQTKSDQKTKTINFKEHNFWDESSANSIQKQIEIIQFQSKSLNFPIPIDFSVSNGSSFLITQKVLLKLEENPYNQFIQNKAKHVFHAELKDDSLHIYIPGLTHCVMHGMTKEHNSELAVDLYATSVLLGIACCLVKLDNRELASKIIQQPAIFRECISSEAFEFLLPHLILSADYKCFIPLLKEIVETIALNEAIELIGKITPVDLMLSKTRQTERELSEHLLLIVEKRLRNDTLQKDHAPIFYNMGNIYRSTFRMRDACKYYVKAKRCDKNYLTRTYYIEELAGVLFLLGRYSLSAHLYEQAYKAGNASSNIQVTLMDSLIKSAQIIKADEYGFEADNPLLRLQKVVLGVLISYISESDYRKQSKMSNDLFENSANINEAICIEAIQYDITNDLAWFNLGVTQSMNQEIPKAMTSFIVCSILQTSDCESWVNAFTLCYACYSVLPESEKSTHEFLDGYTVKGLCQDIFIVASQHCGRQFLVDVPNSLSDNNFCLDSEFEKIASEISNKHPKQFEPISLRQVNGDGSYSTIVEYLTENQVNEKSQHEQARRAQ
jgi:tetratricopeptide (TPR) repeat protein